MLARRLAARVDYEPGDATTALFGGNSNWRGPIWLPVNYLLVEAMERYHHFYGDTLRVECPTGSGRLMNLQEVARELAARLVRIFRADEQGRRVCYGSERVSPQIRTGEISCSSTSTFTATPAKGSAPAIRQAGPRW